MTTLRLTYRELGERTGRTPEGARMLARNHHWRIERGNDGKARVAVDEAELEVVAQPPGQPSGDLSVDHADSLRPSLLRRVERSSADLQRQLAEAHADVERWRAEAEQARTTAIQAVADRDAVRAIAAARPATSSSRVSRQACRRRRSRTSARA
jgi:hypothetical protein